MAQVRPGLDLCQPTSVGGFEGRRIVVMPDEGGVGVSLARELDRLGRNVSGEYGLKLDALDDVFFLRTRQMTE